MVDVTRANDTVRAETNLIWSFLTDYHEIVSWIGLYIVITCFEHSENVNKILYLRVFDNQHLKLHSYKHERCSMKSRCTEKKPSVSKTAEADLNWILKHKDHAKMSLNN